MTTKATTGFGDEDDRDDAVTGEVVDPTNILANARKADPEAATRRMSERMLGAETLDALYDSTKGTTSDELDGKSIEVTGVEWQAYESDRGPIPQAVVQAVDLINGDVFEFVTTATMLVTFLYKAQQLGAIPFKTRIAGKKTKSGNTALNFERI